MDIALFHGYELNGSGSNEYNRYLAASLLKLGHNVHIICRESHPERIPFIGQHWHWDLEFNYEKTILNPAYAERCVLHQIPSGAIYPVYLTDKQRPGNVKSFVEMSDAELDTFIYINESVLEAILSHCSIDVLFANHLVMQPTMALAPCKKHQIPMVFFLHGSAIEYTVRKDTRYLQLARRAVLASARIISGNQEVKNRMLELYPDFR